MKSNAVTSILNGVLGFSVLVCVFFSIQYFFIARQIRALTYQAASINSTEVGVRTLVNECADYGAKNPAIIPVLESVGIKVGKPAPVNGAKPATR